MAGKSVAAAARRWSRALVILCVLTVAGIAAGIAQKPDGAVCADAERLHCGPEEVAYRGRCVLAPFFVLTGDEELQRKANEQGIDVVVNLRSQVDERGRIGPFQVIDSNTPDEAFVRAAERAAALVASSRSAQPACRDGEPVAMPLTVIVAFGPSVTEKRSCAPGEYGDLGLCVKPPVATRKVSPRYPGKALKQGYQATVELFCVVGKDGRVKEVEVVHCTVPGYGFERAARRAVRRWQFEPASVNGVPIEMAIGVRLDFVIEPWWD